jgi:hypothetical protein
MKEGLLNLLAQEAGNGYLAGLYKKEEERNKEEKCAEDNSTAARVIDEILSNDQINQPLINVISSLDNREVQPQKREEDGSNEEQEEEASWAGKRVTAKPDKLEPQLSEDYKRNRKTRARMARLAALEKNIKPAKTTDVSTSTAGNGLINSNVPSLT